jgi:hypothetical protein
MNFRNIINAFCIVVSVSAPWGCSSGSSVEASVGSAQQALSNAPMDINGDGQTDFLWQGIPTGGAGPIQAWFMSGTDVPPLGGVNLRDIGATTDISVAWPWFVVGSGDFDSNGSNDFLLCNGLSGVLDVWFMSSVDGTRRSYVAHVTASGSTSPLTANATNPNLPIVLRVGDFNLDGHPDIIILNQYTGSVTIWMLNGAERFGVQTVTEGSTGLALTVQSPWYLGAVGAPVGGSNFLYFQNPSTGEIQEWVLDHGARIYSSYVHDSTTPKLLAPSPWVLSGAGKINSDSVTDLVFFDRSTGKVQVWFMSSVDDRIEPKYLQQLGSDVEVPSPWQLVPN